MRLLPAQAAAAQAAGQQRDGAGGRGGLHEALEGGRAIRGVVERRPRHGGGGGSISSSLLPRAEQRHRTEEKEKISLSLSLFISLSPCEAKEVTEERGGKEESLE